MVAEASRELVVLELRDRREEDDGGGERGVRGAVVGDEGHGGHADQELAVPGVASRRVHPGGDELASAALHGLELAAPAARGAEVHLAPPRQLEPHRVRREDQREGHHSRRRRAEVAAEGVHQRRPGGLGDEDANDAHDRGGVEGDGGTAPEPPPQADEGVDGKPVGEHAEGEGDGEDAEPVSKRVGARKRHRYSLGNLRYRDCRRESRAEEERVGG